MEWYSILVLIICLVRYLRTINAKAELSLEELRKLTDPYEKVKAQLGPVPDALKDAVMGWLGWKENAVGVPEFDEDSQEMYQNWEFPHLEKEGTTLYQELLTACRWEADTDGKVPKAIKNFDLGEQPQTAAEWGQLKSKRKDVKAAVKPAPSLAALKVLEELEVQDDARLSLIVKGRGGVMEETLPGIGEVGEALRWVTGARVEWEFGKKHVHLVVCLAKPAQAGEGGSATSAGLPDEGTFKGFLTLMEEMCQGTESLGIMVAPSVGPPHWYGSGEKMVAINKIVVHGENYNVSDLKKLKCRPGQ
jgi:hypothetical protein